MARKPGPGSPAGAEANAREAVAEHQRLHKGEKRKPVTQDGPATVYPNVPGQPDPAGPHYAPGEFDPAVEAQRRR